MPNKPAAVAERLAQWRQQGSDRVDPLRFTAIAALARRAQRHQGVVRRQLDARVEALCQAYAQQVAQPLPGAAAVVDAPSPLRLLMAPLEAAQRSPDVPLAAPTTTPGETRAAAETSEGAVTPMLDEFQQLWSQVRIDSLLRQCLESAPEDAGPLHSSVLLHRAMSRMREVCPAYLQHFIAYADALSWMEQLSGASGNNAESTSSPRKRRASTPRTKKAKASDPNA